jgi:hypothetical protein
MIYSFDRIILSRTDSGRDRERRKTDAIRILSVESVSYSSFKNYFINCYAIVDFHRLTLFAAIFFVRK